MAGASEPRPARPIQDLREWLSRVEETSAISYTNRPKS
jgi:hypothetical protein